jgi:hypothetical protein
MYGIVYTIYSMVAKLLLKLSNKSINNLPGDNTLLIVFLSGTFFVKINRNIGINILCLGMEVAIK